MMTRRGLSIPLFWNMLSRGVYLPPSQFETCFISLALEDEMIEETVNNIAIALREIFYNRSSTQIIPAQTHFQRSEQSWRAICPSLLELAGRALAMSSFSSGKCAIIEA